MLMLSMYIAEQQRCASYPAISAARPCHSCTSSERLLHSVMPSPPPRVCAALCTQRHASCHKSCTCSRSPVMLTSRKSSGSAASPSAVSKGTDTGCTNSCRFILMLLTIFASLCTSFLFCMLVFGTRYGTPPGGNSRSCFTCSQWNASCTSPQHHLVISARLHRSGVCSMFVVAAESRVGLLLCSSLRLSSMHVCAVCHNSRMQLALAVQGGTSNMSQAECHSTVTERRPWAYQGTQVWDVLVLIVEHGNGLVAPSAGHI